MSDYERERARLLREAEGVDGVPSSRLVVNFGGPRPTIVCLCGSSRFRAGFATAARDESRAGRIVLSAHEFDRQITAAERVGYDELHRRQIDLADEVLVVSDESGYYGDSTRSEIEYARGLGKPVRFLVDERSTS